MLTVSDYADWVYHEVTSMPPHMRVLNDWQCNWCRTLNGIALAKGIFELISMVLSKCEFLGSLFRGNINKETSAHDMVEYVTAFLQPVNQNYQNIHNLSGRPNQRSEFFSVFRNKPLHGGTPAGILDANSQNIFTWWIGFSPSTRANHLTVVNGSIHVDGNLLMDEFRQSLTAFALFLQANNRFSDNSLPSERFQRAFWVRFLPLYLPIQDWLQEGTRRGIPR